MYHYGITITEYREKIRMTQQYLADHWPKSERFGGGEGVSINYIQDIEHGRKRIDDHQTLRKVCFLLHIPLWKVGLGEYDPFTTTLTGQSTYMKTFELIDFTLRQIWILRKASLLHPAREALRQLGTVFTYFETDDTPPIQAEARYLHLFADYQCVNGVLAVDAMQYDQALCFYQRMYEIAKELDNPALIAHSLMNLGVEHDRKKDYVL
jgi:transcriptional regulator with XRE-family HTH domain